MNRFLIVAILSLAAAPATAAERRYSVTDFDRVQIEGPFEVTLRTGLPNAAIATGASGEIDRVAIDVQGRTLRIRPNSAAWGGYPGETAGLARIALATHDLRSLTIRGAARVEVDRARAMRVDLAVSGNGSLRVGQIETDRLVLGLTGSGTIAVGGAAKAMLATVEGSGDLDGSALSVDDLDLNAGTSGKVDLKARRTARINATGVGTVVIAGAPACTVRQTGSGPVLCGKASDQRQRR